MACWHLLLQMLQSARVMYPCTLGRQNARVMFDGNRASWSVFQFMYACQGCCTIFLPRTSVEAPAIQQ